MKSKILNEEGLFNLAVHTACCYNQSYSIDEIPEWCDADYKTYLEEEGLNDISIDKMTIDDRVKWVINNEDLIINSQFVSTVTGNTGWESIRLLKPVLGSAQLYCLTCFLFRILGIPIFS